MQNQISPKTVALTFGILILIFVIGFYISAWTEPAAAPPTGNISTPVNVGATTQYKSGALGVGGLFTTDNSTYLATLSGNVGIGTASPNPTYKLDVNGKINATELCIGGTCQSSWPSGGGGFTTLYRMVVAPTPSSYCPGYAGYSAASKSYTCSSDSTPVFSSITTASCGSVGNACSYAINGSMITVTANLCRQGCSSVYSIGWNCCDDPLACQTCAVVPTCELRFQCLLVQTVPW